MFLSALSLVLFTIFQIPLFNFIEKPEDDALELIHENIHEYGIYISTGDEIIFNEAIETSFQLLNNGITL